MTSPVSETRPIYVHRILRRMGVSCKFPALHVAGTNGKGSTCACLDAMLRAAGYKTALFTSPHLSVFGERLRVDGRMLEAAAWHEAFDAVQTALRDCPECRLGYFQLLTAAAFWLIERIGVDAAVIEVGIGGAKDSTNVIPKPLLSVITPLGMDHMHLLGNSMSSIAANKFGIVKDRAPALYCGSPSEVNGQFLRACEQKRARGKIFSRRCVVADVKSTLDGTEFTLSTPRGTARWFVRLLGTHQSENAALALRALELVSDKLPVSTAAKRAGLASVVWPGRMEVFRRNPELILDGAHNPHGAAALVRALTVLYPKDAPLSFVYASMADKNYMDALKQYVQAFPEAKLFCTELSGNDRCESASALAGKAAVLPWKTPPAVFVNPSEALEAALARGGPVIVCGSLYFIARIRELLKNAEL